MKSIESFIVGLSVKYSDRGSRRGSGIRRAVQIEAVERVCIPSHIPQIVLDYNIPDGTRRRPLLCLYYVVQCFLDRECSDKGKSREKNCGRYLGRCLTRSRGNK